MSAMRAIRCEELELEMGLPEYTIYHQARAYKSRVGRYPKWYITRGSGAKIMINVELYMRHYTLAERIHSYSSNKLYWAFRATNHSDYDIAKIMASRSSHFKNITSWQRFFDSDLFVTSNQLVVKPTLRTEFVRCGTKYLYLLKKSGKLDLSKEKEYYD